MKFVARYIDIFGKTICRRTINAPTLEDAQEQARRKSIEVRITYKQPYQTVVVKEVRK